jgi:cyclopropane fatty-acyl-phospholipid synthase-like methyltransferase
MEEAVSGSISIFPIQLPEIMTHQTDTPEPAFSIACERNKEPILNILKKELADVTEVWEIGSGTGQHAVFFAEALPHLTWQPCDLKINHHDIQTRITIAKLPNLQPPLELDVNHFPWPLNSVQAIFSANTLHIVSQTAVQDFFKGIGKSLQRGGKLCVYGPFNYQGHYTSESNARFDRQLKQNSPASGIRDFEWIDHLARESGCSLHCDHEMPANNRLLVWKKEGSS